MSFTKEKRDQIKKYMLDKISQESTDVVQKTVSTFYITRNTAYRYIKELIRDNIIEKNGKKYVLVSHKESYTFQMKDIPKDSEDQIFEQFVEPVIKDLPDNALRIWYYCFTEMMNNVIDHSAATEVSIYISRNYMNTTLILNDNGIGIFNKIQEYYHFDSVDDAILELFKGKLTTDEKNHSGEGIFFSSRIMDVFAAISSGKVFSHTEFNEIIENLEETPELKNNDMLQTGTAIFMKLSNHTKKTTREIMDQYSDVNGGFIRTIIPIKNIYPTYPVSRSQAKRLTNRLESFQEILLDFSGVKEIGQGFAHELFVVFQRNHPDIQLIPYNANVDVQRMISHVTN